MALPPPIDRDEVSRRFRHYAPSETRAAQHVDVRTSLAEAAGHLADTLPEGREKSLAVTALEEAMFWSNAAIARSAPTPVAFSDVVADGDEDEAADEAATDDETPGTLAD